MMGRRRVQRCVPSRHTAQPASRRRTRPPAHRPSTSRTHHQHLTRKPTRYPRTAGIPQSGGVVRAKTEHARPHSTTRRRSLDDRTLRLLSGHGPLRPTRPIGGSRTDVACRVFHQPELLVGCLNRRTHADAHRWTRATGRHHGSWMDETLIGYARCSTDEQDLTAQRQALHALGVPPDRVYIDHGISGTNAERPASTKHWPQYAPATRSSCRSSTVLLDRFPMLETSVTLSRSVGCRCRSAVGSTTRTIRWGSCSSTFSPRSPSSRWT